MSTACFPDFTRLDLTLLGETRPVYIKGEGPAVVVMHEAPGLYPAVADGYGMILVPFFLDGVAADPNLNQADFIHPTAEGYAVVIETLYPYVVEAITSLGP